MDVMKMVGILRDRWLLLVAAAVIGASAGLGISMLMTSYYTSTTQLFVTTTGGTTSTESYQGDQFSQQRASSYAQILSSEILGQRVVDSLGLPLTASEVAGKISAERLPQTVLIEVTVRDTSARRAADIANTVSDEFIRYIAPLETPTGQEQARATVSVINGAEPASAPSSPNTVTNVLYGAFIGLILGSVLIALRRLTDPSVSKSTLSSLTGSPVLGPISRSDRGHHLAVWDAPEAEPLRKIRVFLQSGRPVPRVLLVTTASEIEDALNFAIDLAVVFAETDSPTVLVETNSSRPTLATELSLQSGPGLVDILTGYSAVVDAVQLTANPYLTAVVVGGARDTSPMLSSIVMKEAVETLLATHQTVILVAAPMSTSSAASVLSSVADGALLLVDSEVSSRRSIVEAVTELGECQANLLATVCIDKQ